MGVLGPIWYVPSFYGDISLKRADKGVTIAWHDLTAVEKEALGSLKTLCADKGWGELDLDKVEQTLLDAPFDKVKKALAKSLKAGRALLDAVVFRDGKVLESSTLPETAKAGVTVAAPTKGCPQPEFDDIEIRATRVLENFLSADQLADFRRYQTFTAVGGDTGHAYLVVSRNATRIRNQYGQVYDLDEKRTLCVHDWEAPAAEEMLTLKLHLELAGKENFVRFMPEDHDALL